MIVVTTKYIRKPLFVDAVLVTEENFTLLATWCKGETMDYTWEEPTKGYIKVPVINPKNARQSKAYVGDWLLWTEQIGFKVYTEKAFRNSFDEMPLIPLPDPNQESLTLSEEADRFDVLVEKYGPKTDWEKRVEARMVLDTQSTPTAPSPAVCNRCGAPKGLQALGEACNMNCGGVVVVNTAA